MVTLVAHLVHNRCNLFSTLFKFECEEYLLTNCKSNKKELLIVILINRVCIMQLNSDFMWHYLWVSLPCPCCLPSFQYPSWITPNSLTSMPTPWRSLVPSLNCPTPTHSYPNPYLLYVFTWMDWNWKSVCKYGNAFRLLYIAELPGKYLLLNKVSRRIQKKGIRR